MPLLTSPIDGSPMKQVVRNGIEIDICPATGGVWLDKGELEKLLSLVQEAATDDDEEDFKRFKNAKAAGRFERDEFYHSAPPPRYRRYEDDDYDDYYKYKYGKKKKLRSILDIFD